MSNNSMDVRAKQRLSYNGSSFISACVLLVSPHVISAVMPFVVNMLRTPKNRISVIFLAVALYLTAPLVEWYFYTTELTRGSFPPDADSISIPLFQFASVGF